MIDEARVDSVQGLQEQSKEKLVSQGVKRKVFQLASIKHQGKTLSMLGEIGVGWRPKTGPKNKLRFNMKKLLNPKLAQKKIIVIEDSSSQEDLEEDEGLDVKEMKGEKQVTLKDMSVLTKTKILELLKEVQRKVVLDHHQDDSMKQHSVMTSFCAEKEKIAEASAQCSFEVNESLGAPVAMKK